MSTFCSFFTLAVDQLCPVYSSKLSIRISARAHDRCIYRPVPRNKNRSCPSLVCEPVVRRVGGTNEEICPWRREQLRCQLWFLKFGGSESLLLGLSGPFAKVFFSSLSAAHLPQRAQVHCVSLSQGARICLRASPSAVSLPTAASAVETRIHTHWLQALAETGS